MPVLGLALSEVKLLFFSSSLYKGNLKCTILRVRHHTELKAA